ncbi:MAG: hypothetical protein KC505_10740 [Myxococcales bacterium]|nr:hypothetical protein [Myxococcales bacterium]USN50042.1 MAG: hypothetical protein H6731_07145 [Myxococcales bacterium]
MFKALLISLIGLIFIVAILVSNHKVAPDESAFQEGIVPAPHSRARTLDTDNSTEPESFLEPVNDKHPELSLEELEQKIERIDKKIIDRNYIELANRGALSTAEMEHLKTLLSTRDKFFEIKVALLLSDA